MHILISIALWIVAVVAVVVVLYRNLEDRPIGILLLLCAMACVLGGLLGLSHPAQVDRILFFIRA